MNRTQDSWNCTSCPIQNARLHLCFSTALWVAGGKILQKDLGQDPDARRFRSFFGVSPAVCSLVWDTIGTNLPRGGMPEHLLWALMFLKIYSTEHVHCSFAKCDEKTYRKWSWCFVMLIADLNVVSMLHFANLFVPERILT